MYLLGYDIGSSSIKAALIDADNGEKVGVVQYPELEMDIISNHPGWAEQHPEVWWDCICKATKKLLYKTNIDPSEILSIGIAYQMHGLVLVDKQGNVLRPSIIWCDSRAIEIGNEAFRDLGKEKCLEHYLNSPGNFTASKLKWVKDNEPEVYSKIHKIMLPGDYIAMKLTGRMQTTVSGLSEGIMWDFKNNSLAGDLLNYYGIDEKLIPDIVDTFSLHGKITKSAAENTGLSTNTFVSYRAGDQPNNAISLGVHKPNEVAATGGTSGVVYGITDEYVYDNESRINGFAHVNHTPEHKRIGILLCINGAGIQYSWVKQQIAREGISYNDMERMLSSIPVGADGLRIIPFGNGAERILSNKETGGQINNLQFNRHTRAHIYRAAIEGIAFSFVHGLGIMKELGIDTGVIKVGNDNLFQSAIFSSTISNLMGCEIQVVDTTGAVGAAKGSGVGAGFYKTLEDAFKNNIIEKIYNPVYANGIYDQAYSVWNNDLKILVKHQQ